MAELTPLGIDGSWLYQAEVHQDPRGHFIEWFKHELIRKELGRNFLIQQSNFSNSKKGVVRGIHFSVASQGQAKWITCTSGSLFDVVVDIRPNSKTFKKWVGLEMSAESGKSILVSEGLGHAFLSLQDETTISYLLTSPYSPNEEFAINPKDPEIGIKWPLDSLQFSKKDEAAPSLSEMIEILRKSPHTGSN